jgi:tetratricopeptide (TPR) repeat protein
VSTSDSSADPSLETRVTGVSTPGTASTTGTALELGSGLGRYLPIEELGRGGMGRVLRAYDPKLQREVALKVLHARAVDPLARARLVREARTMAKLGHPNVVAVYDVDDDPEHGVMLAMELVKGSTLRAWLRQQPRRWPEILAAFVEAGRGLAAAHGEGLLHRDFKPANVLIPHEGSGGRGSCKVTDFGLAKLEHDQGPSTSGVRAPLPASSTDASGEVLTQAGTVIGTPRYMAPEQHFGEALTSAADQFSFCVSLWDALYGEPPFTGNTPTELGSLLSRSGAYPEAEAALEQAYFEAATGMTSEVAFDAAAALVDQVGMRAARPVEGRRWGRLAEVALLDVPDGEQLRQAVLLINLANIDQVVGALDEAKGRYERALAIGEQALGPEHPGVVGPLSNLATIYAMTGAYDEAKVLYVRALAIMEQTLGPEHPDVAAGLTNLASMHATTGAYDEAKVLYVRALALWERTLGPEHPDLNSVLDNLASVHQLTGAYGEAKVLFERSLVIGEKTLGPEHPAVASTLDSLANVHHATGAHGEAKVLYERALAIHEKVLGSEHPDLAFGLVGLANVALAQHRPGDAVPLAQRAVTLRENSEVPAEQLAAARLVLARVLWEAPDDAGRDRARARTLAEQARDVFRARGNAPELAEVEQWLADHPGVR